MTIHIDYDREENEIELIFRISRKRDQHSKHITLTEHQLYQGVEFGPVRVQYGPPEAVTFFEGFHEFSTSELLFKNPMIQGEMSFSPRKYFREINLYFPNTP